MHTRNRDYLCIPLTNTKGSKMSNLATNKDAAIIDAQQTITDILSGATRDSIKCKLRILVDHTEYVKRYSHSEQVEVSATTETISEVKVISDKYTLIFMVRAFIYSRTHPRTVKQLYELPSEDVSFHFDSVEDEYCDILLFDFKKSDNAQVITVDASDKELKDLSNADILFKETDFLSKGQRKSLTDFIIKSINELEIVAPEVVDTIISQLKEQGLLALSLK